MNIQKLYRSLIHTVLGLTWLVDVLSILGVITYAFRILRLVPILDLNMDEGTYLMKGLLFTSGKYAPYQFFGPWTQKMPLAYFLYGWAQDIFEPGLRTGRYLAAFLSILVVIGTWLLIRQLGGKWLGMLGVLYFVLNQAGMAKYGLATTQPIAAVLGVWALVLILRQNPGTWQIILASILSGLLVITRQNLLPLTGFLLLYVFLTMGWKKGGIALAVVCLVVLFPHILYFPNILQLWTILPQAITPFLEPWRVNFETWTPTPPTIISQLDAFMEAVRYFFIPMVGALFAIIFCPPRKKWNNEHSYAMYLFLVVSWITLLAVHLYMSYVMEYGVYTFSGYVAFFQYIGLALIAITFPYWSQLTKDWIKWVSGIMILSIPALIGYVTYRQLDWIVKWFLTPIPRFKLFELLPGKTSLLAIMEGKLHIPYPVLDVLLPILTGLVIGIGIILGASWISKRTSSYSTITLAALGILIVGLILTPHVSIGGGHQELTCSFDVLSSNEQVGDNLSSRIPPEATVYWYPWLAPAPLLYLDHPKIFPAQLDDHFTYVKGGDPSEVNRFGFWNAQLAMEWLSTADFVLVADTDIYGHHNTAINKLFSPDTELKALKAIQAPMSCKERRTWYLFIYEVIDK